MPGVGRTAVAGLIALLALSGCSSASTSTIDIPNELAGKYQQGAQNGKYVFYAPAGKIPNWNSVAKAGIFVCSQSRPPLIPEAERGSIDGGGFPSGTVLSLTTSDITGGLGIAKLVVTVPAAVNGCTEVAWKQMSETPGMLLMVDANASFPEKDKLTAVLPK